MRYRKGCDPLLRRYRSFSCSADVRLDHALATSSSVISSPAGLEMMKMVFSLRMSSPSLIGFVAKTLHPIPGDGLCLKGASSGILMLRYARRGSGSVSPMYGTLDTYDVAQTWRFKFLKLGMAVVCEGGRKKMERRRLWDVSKEVC